MQDRTPATAHDSGEEGSPMEQLCMAVLEGFGTLYLYGLMLAVFTYMPYTLARDAARKGKHVTWGVHLVEALVAVGTALVISSWWLTVNGGAHSSRDYARWIGAALALLFFARVSWVRGRRAGESE